MTHTAVRTQAVRVPGRAVTSRDPGDAGRQLAVCAAVAALSLALPAGLGYDPWAWLVWGRELTDGTFSTVGGPSWKPLPVVVTAPASLLGDVAPPLWSLVARTGGLFAVVLVFRLATRFAGRAAGVVAAALFVLGPDGESRLLRHLSQSNIDPLTAAACLWAAERHLDGRHGQTLLLLGVASLSRPEVWPFLVLYGGWMLWRDPTRWRLVVPVLAVVPAAWFGGDWLGAGDPLVGAARAQVLDEGTVSRAAGVLGRIGAVVIVPAWVAVGVGVGTALRRREAALVVLALAAAAWLVEVAAMTVFLGYAGLSRFLQPAVGVVCVLAGVGAVRGVQAVAPAGRPALRLTVAAAVLVAVLPFALPRVAWVGRQAVEAAERQAIDADLRQVLDDVGGRAELLACGAVAIDNARPALESRPSVAWKRDLALEQVRYRIRGRSGTAIVYAGGAQDRELSSREAPAARELARTDRWAAFAVRCGPAPG